MSKYPRISATQKKPNNVSAKCRCGEVGKFRIEIQTSYMRGDDEYVWACQQHKADANYLMGTQQ